MFDDSMSIGGRRVIEPEIFCEAVVVCCSIGEDAGTVKDAYSGWLRGQSVISCSGVETLRGRSKAWQ